MVLAVLYLTSYSTLVVVNHVLAAIELACHDSTAFLCLLKKVLPGTAILGEVLPGSWSTGSPWLVAASEGSAGLCAHNSCSFKYQHSRDIWSLLLLVVAKSDPIAHVVTEGQSMLVR